MNNYLRFNPHNLVNPRKKYIRQILRLVKICVLGVFIFIVTFQLVKINSYLSKIDNQAIYQTSLQLEVLQKEIDEVKEYLLFANDKQEFQQSQSAKDVITDLLKGYQEDLKQTKMKNLALNTFQQAKNKLEDIIVKSNFISETTEYSEGVNYKVTNPISELNLFTLRLAGHTLFLTNEFEELSWSFDQKDVFSRYIGQYTTVESLIKYEEKLKKAENAVRNLSELSALLKGESLDSSRFQKMMEIFNTRSLKTDTNDNLNLLAINILKSDNSKAFVLKYDLEKELYQITNDQDGIISKQVENQQELFQWIESYLRLNTFDTLSDKNMRAKITEFDDVFNSPIFQSLLHKLNLFFKKTESEVEVVFEVYNAQNNTVFKIIINKENGTVRTEMKEKTTIINQSISMDKQANKTILIAGKQGNLTDSLILANVNEDLKQVNLLSIPRDLYYQGKKINSIYTHQDMNSLVATVEKISGQPIEHYLMIDMYSFIDIVDLVGGVSVELQKEVIDPTYKTFDNGVWGTMHFNKGVHLLSGVQALRLARSRYTSSDFARAERQQMLLTALRDKLAGLGVQNMKTLTHIFLALLDKTETNLNLNQAISYFFKYRNYEISNKIVLSTQNILTSTYSNIYNQSTCLECGRGAYILLPKNEDWSLIQTFVSQIFNS